MSDTPEDNKPEDETPEPERFPLVKSYSAELVDDDDTDDGISGIRTVSDEMILFRIKKRADAISYEFALLGRDLWLCKSRAIYKVEGYNSFEDYCWNGLGMPLAQCQRLTSIFEKYVYECLIPLDDLKQVGVTKATMMLALVNRDNAKSWVEKASKNSIKLIRKEIREIKDSKKKFSAVKVENSSAALLGPKDPTETLPVTYEPSFPDPNAAAAKVYPNLDPTAIPGDDVNPVKVEFVVFPEQYHAIKKTLSVMAAASGSKSDAHNLCMIFSEFLARKAEYGEEKDALPSAILQMFQLAYGGKVFWVQVPDTAETLTKLIEEHKLGGITHE